MVRQVPAYRVEDPRTGLGPYQAITDERCAFPGLHDALYYEREMGWESMEAWKERCPSPYLDTVMWDAWSRIVGTSRYYFAFASLEQARAWFLSDQWLALRQHGFVLAGYRVPSIVPARLRHRSYDVDMPHLPGVIRGRAQVAFHYEAAQRVRTVRIPERWCWTPLRGGNRAVTVQPTTTPHRERQDVEFDRLTVHTFRAG